MIVTCPKCARKFATHTTMQESAMDAWFCVQSRKMTNKTFAASRGLSPASVTLYRRLGICIMELGLNPIEEPELWTALSHDARANSDPELRHAIESRYDLQFIRDLVLKS
jgi:hypothetical protein